MATHNSAVSAEERWRQANLRRQARAGGRGDQSDDDHPSSSSPSADSFAIWIYGLAAVLIIAATIVFVNRVHGLEFMKRGQGKEDGGEFEWPERGEVEWPEGGGDIGTAPKVATPPMASAFVGVRDGKFEVFCRPFYIAGFNAHDLVEISMQHAKRFRMQNGVSGHLRVRETFREASAAGLNTVRIWGFTNHEKFPFQESPGVYDEDALEGLDYVLSEARQYGLRVIVVLADNWKYLNGADQYVDWSSTAPKRTQQRPRDNLGELSHVHKLLYEGARHALFYKDKGSRKIYKKHLKTMVERRNHIHGRLYKDDPTIFAWELINEARCNVAHNPTCTADVQAWIEEMSKYMKKIDGNHIVSIGAEGFFAGGHEWSGANPGRWAQRVGQSYVENHAPDTIDFGAIHSWPDNWNRPDLQFQENWVRMHGRVNTEILGKPVLLEEFGKRLEPGEQDSEWHIKEIRDPLYRDTLNIVSESIENGENIAGALFWRLHLDTYEGKGRGRYGVKTSDSTFYYIRNFAADIHDVIHSQPPAPVCKTECWVPYVEESRRLCIQDANACKIYWGVRNGGDGTVTRNASEVLVPIWDQEILLSDLKFFTSWLDCCRKGVGAFTEGCDFQSGFASW